MVKDELTRDLKTLAMFISLYCKCKHTENEKTLVEMKTHDVAAIAGRPIALCSIRPTG